MQLDLILADPEESSRFAKLVFGTYVRDHGTQGFYAGRDVLPFHIGHAFYWRHILAVFLSQCRNEGGL